MLRSAYLLRPPKALIVLSALFTVDLGVVGAQGGTVTPLARNVWMFAFGLFVAWWIAGDRRQRSYAAPFEFEAAIFYAWPVLLPYYLYRTRGGNGLLLTLGVYGLFFGPALVGGIAGGVVEAVYHVP